MISQWFGPFPPWMELYLANVKRLEPHGYDWFIDTDLEGVKDRVWDTVGLRFPGEEGGAKAHDLRPLLGLLYEEELAGYDYWGHTDLDCVYGRVWEWLDDERLGALDVFSNHVDYMCGPWSLYRNTPFLRELFRETPGWHARVQEDATTGWVEKSFTAVVDAAHAAGRIRRQYAMLQTKRIGANDDVRWDGPRLVDGGDEIFMAHFNRSKVYPPGAARV